MAQDQTNDRAGNAGVAKMPTNGAPTHEHAELLHRYHTAQSVVIPREVFEEIYLEPTARKKGTRLGTIFGNPTPMYVFLPMVSGNLCFVHA